MSEIKWTKEQNDAITKKDSNILVAAAAGSGKTTVLVERIIRKIIDEKIDIDKMLVVTFTSAAASEMREKILDAIYKKIDENPNDLNLQKQVNLLNKSNICTIDSFCLDIIRNNFFEIDTSANARVADTAEINLIKQEVIDDIFEEKYMNNDLDFKDLIEKYTKYNRDEELQDLILDIYNFMQTTPFPDEWLEEKVKMFNEEITTKKLSENIWGKIVLNNIEERLNDCIYKEKSILEKMKRFPELEKFISTVEIDIENYNNVKSSLNDWDKTAQMISDFKYNKWPTDKKIQNELKEEAKQIRDKNKAEFEKIKEIIKCDTNQIYEDMLYMYKVLINLKNIILEFSEKFKQKKIEKNIIDFNDIEHLALKILVKKNENGDIEKTNVAKKYSEKFKEIAIDEYQDSNEIQEIILNSVSKNNNIFMVGDVKQSIYKFRQACPELFLNKYDSYKINPEENENRKIQLFKNFRSRKNILDITNVVFKNIMSKELGDIEYNEEEYLNLGANYEEIADQNFKTELNIINLKEEENIWKDSEKEENDDENEKIENVVLEARLVAKRIKELVDNKYQVFDKKQGKRDIKYSDIAVLLRSANVVAPIYEKEISDLGINVYTDSSKGYLESIEVDTIISVLKVINNPMQDIPLVTVMRSAIGNFTDNELIEISFEKEKVSFYNKAIKCMENTKNEKLKNKIKNFLNLLDKWRKEEKYEALDELIWSIYIDTGYLEYVRLLQNGKLKAENLKLFFEKAKQYESSNFKGLYNFINFIDKVKLSSGDSNSAKIIGENENVVRIMSIHKSKGLEFPIVILAESGKKFNFMSLNKKLLLHKDLGIGPQYIDENRHIEFKTLAKTAINIEVKQEMIAEEMRILYVALTRAKEKLIITGIQKDYYKSNNEKTNNLMSYNYNEKIPSHLIKKYNSYLDWLELVYIRENKNINDLIDLNIISKENLIKDVITYEKDDRYEQFKEKAKNTQVQEEIRERLNWKYDFKGLEKVPAKMSVTKLKEIYNQNIKNENILKRQKIEKIKPKFLDKNASRITGAQKGTLIHLCLKMMNQSQEYDKNKIEELINKLVEIEIITENEAKAIDKENLLKYTQSELWRNLKKAKQVYKEQPFYIHIPVKDLYSEINSKENILVQGIIDLYYISENDEIVLVDYKTDIVNNGEEQKLINEYSKQLEIYKKALEQAINKKVDKVYIYSLYLNKNIEYEG